MEQGFAIFAAITGFAALIGAVLSSFLKMRLARHRRAKRHSLELIVNGELISIDVSRIDREDPDKLNRAIKAVRDVRVMPDAA